MWKNTLKKYGKRALLFSLTLGLICIIFFYTVGGKIAYVLFKTENIDSITRTLSLICPFVFINTTYKSILNAMGRSYHILINNMFTETLCLFFIVFLIPKYGYNAYITGIIISQGINSVLCIFIFNKYIRQGSKYR